MTPATIIKDAAADGVTLTLTTAGTIRAKGEQAAVNRWAPLIQQHKPGIVVLLGETVEVRLDTTIGLPVTQKERAELAGLITDVAAFHGFTPEETLEAREVAAGDERAALICFRELAKQYGITTSPDDRVTCGKCANLTRSGQCMAAQRGELEDTYKGYHPEPTIKRHCECYCARGAGAFNGH